MTKTCPRCSEVQDAHYHRCLCGYRFMGTGADRQPLPAPLPASDPSESFASNTTAVSGGAEVTPLRTLSTPVANLPAPLGDPLRGLRTGLCWMNGVVMVYLSAVTGWLLFAGELLAAGVVAVSAPIQFVWLWGVIRLLPDRPTDVLYLRSFRTDADTAAVRTSLERALGEVFRVSGIREPRRRWPAVVRFMSYLLFAFKYAHPKYMNLEAGREWKGRLWRSLGECRGVVIDAADLTPAVQAELRLCVKCVGWERILFVVRDTASPVEWKRRIVESLVNEGERSVSPEQWKQRIDALFGPSGQTTPITVASWSNDAKQLARFEEQVEAFGKRLPARAAGFAPDARSLAEQLPDEHFRESNQFLLVEVALGLIAGTVLTAGVYTLRELGFCWQGVAFLVSLCWAIVVRIQYYDFKRNCGSPRCRHIAGWVVAPIRLMVALQAISLLTSLLLSAVQNVHAAAARMKSANDLRYIAFAMHGYAGAEGRLPAANAVGEGPHRNLGRHPVSWRVAILPYLGDERSEALYRMYRFDEPWDGPNNQKLLPLIPPVYHHPMADPKKVPAGHTFYRVFASQPAVKPSSVFVDGQPGPTIGGIPDGSNKTILVVEAAESVPWTQPEVLNFAPDEALPKLGGHFRGGFNAVMVDGWAHFIRSDMTESKLRARVTANGGEVVDDD